MTFEKWFEENLDWIESKTDMYNFDSWKALLEKAYNAGFKEGCLRGENNCMPDFDDYPD